VEAGGLLVQEEHKYFALQGCWE